MLFAFYCGANSVDSQTWMMSAAFKQVQLPGSPWTRFSPREAEKNPAKYEQTREAFAERLLQLTQDENFAVKDWNTGEDRNINNESEALIYIDYLEDRNGINHIHRRACHNLYALNFEASRVRQEKDLGKLEDFICGRMKETIYQTVFEYAFEKVASNP